MRATLNCITKSGLTDDWKGNKATAYCKILGSTELYYTGKNQLPVYKYYILQFSDRKMSLGIEINIDILLKFFLIKFTKYLNWCLVLRKPSSVSSLY